jgi:hypothetical protein
MDFLNKIFKNRVTGDTFEIIDVYQNIAITDKKEKINTSLLANERLFSPMTSQNIKTMNESRNYKEDSVDPNKFFNSQNTYNTFAEKIKNIPLDQLPNETSTSNVTSSINPYQDLGVSTNESAIITVDPQDEIEELKRKYGATTIDDSIRVQNEKFAKILDPQPEQPQEVQRVEVSREPIIQNQIYSEPPIQRVEVQDPVTMMFKNVKRNLDFHIDLKVEGKIPRLDFIEMMEDSYEVSIIDFLAEEFTQNLLKDPNLIRNKIKSEIKRLLESNSKNVTPKEVSNKESISEAETKKVQKRPRGGRTTKKEEKITTAND